MRKIITEYNSGEFSHKKIKDQRNNYLTSIE